MEDMYDAMMEIEWEQNPKCLKCKEDWEDCNCSPSTVEVKK